MYNDFALRTVLYTILCIGAIGISTGKLFAINHGISKYLAKKSDSGNFKTVKTTFISLGIEYVSIAIIALFISLCTINTIYTNAFLMNCCLNFSRQLLPYLQSLFLVQNVISVCGYSLQYPILFWLLQTFSFCFSSITNSFTKILKFLKIKKWNSRFSSTCKRTVWIVNTIRSVWNNDFQKYDLMLRRFGYEIHIHICYTRHLCRCSKHRKSFSSKFRYFKIPF